jgi:hypothetical protein
MRKERQFLAPEILEDRHPDHTTMWLWTIQIPPQRL